LAPTHYGAHGKNHSSNRDVRQFKPRETLNDFFPLSASFETPRNRRNFPLSRRFFIHLRNLHCGIRGSFFKIEKSSPGAARASGARAPRLDDPAAIDSESVSSLVVISGTAWRRPARSRMRAVCNVTRGRSMTGPAFTCPAGEPQEFAACRPLKWSVPHAQGKALARNKYLPCLLFLS
jgi:hypothetical protein